jgi:hypothetical protein
MGYQSALSEATLRFKLNHRVSKGSVNLSPSDCPRSDGGSVEIMQIQGTLIKSTADPPIRLG